MATVWRPRMGVAAKDLSNNTYLFQFFHELDLQRVLNDGPWSFEQSLLVLAKAQPDIPPTATPLETADFWIQIHDLPLGFFSEKAVMAIGNFIGDFLSIDDDSPTGWWKSFIRIRVRINITKPLASGMRIRRNGGDWSWISFRYERLPNFCFICSLIGHTEKFCIKPFEGYPTTAERQFGAWLRAQTQRPSPVSGNRWVVMDHDGRKTTTDSTEQNQGSTSVGTSALPAMVQRTTQRTFPTAMEHVSPGTSAQDSFRSHDDNDVQMVQIDNTTSDGLTLDQKRKMTDSLGPIVDAIFGSSNEPTSSFIDLNGPHDHSKNLLRAGPTVQARPEQ